VAKDLRFKIAIKTTSLYFSKFTKPITNCLEGALFFPNFDRNFLAVSVEDSPLWKKVFNISNISTFLRA